jgi:hypothetical protein
VADRSSALLISALTRAAADADGVPLHGKKDQPGLFPTTALGKQTAQRYCDEGYFSQVPHEGGNGRSAPLCTITDKGMKYLLGQASPRQVLDDCVRILEAREGQLAQLLISARKMQAGLESLRGTVAGVLAKMDAPVGDLKALFAEFRRDKPPTDSADPSPAVVAALERWASSGAQDDCPMPDLYRQVEAACKGVTIGSFHDAMRRLHASNQVYLHPWTGPLYEIPEPPYALLVGHEIAYYASLQAATR